MVLGALLFILGALWSLSTSIGELPEGTLGGKAPQMIQRQTTCEPHPDRNWRIDERVVQRGAGERAMTPRGSRSLYSAKHTPPALPGGEQSLFAAQVGIKVVPIVGGRLGSYHPRRA